MPRTQYFFHRPPSPTTLLHDSFNPEPAQVRSTKPRRKRLDSHGPGGARERWAFNLASEKLFTLGSTDSTRRTVYYSDQSGLRWLRP